MVLLSSMTVRAINIAVLSFCSLILLVILLSYPRFKLKNRASRIFYAKMLVSLCMIVCYDISFIHGSEDTDVFSVIARSMAYAGLYAVYVLYILYILEQVSDRQKTRKPPNLIIYFSVFAGVIGAILWILSFFSPSLGELNDLVMGYSKVFIIGNFGGFILVMMSVILLIKNKDILGKRETRVLMSMPVLISVSTLLEPAAQGIVLRYPSVLLEFLIVYTQHHVELETKQEKEATEGLRHRLNMTADRMNPHYLYNVLTTIYYLCETDPKKAQHAVGTFAEYMKSTLEAVERQELVSFNWELREIRNYLLLEKIRFGDKMNIVYDIECDDFLIPPMTVQPLVENAVRHGISAKEGDGTITITSRKLSDGGAQIRVRDDGVGFDVENLSDDNKHQEGITNLRKRLKREVNGELTVTSAQGKGTTAIITIRH